MTRGDHAAPRRDAAYNAAGTAAGKPADTAADTAAALARGFRRVVFLALVIRVALFPFADNKQADAPMRALLAERMNLDASAAADPRVFCQFGPLPILILRPFLALDPDARRSSRLPSLIAGVAVFWPFFALGRRMGATPAALLLAGLALALSPLAIQVSITAASEALYLPLLLGAFERLHAALSRAPSPASRVRWRDFALAGVLASLAAVTRYDTWLAIPAAVVAAVVFCRRDRATLGGLALFAGLAVVLPAAYLVWSWRKSGDPFFFARYISADHAGLAAATSARLGAGVARLRQLGIWAISFIAAMTPALFLAIPAAARAWRRWSAATRVVLAATLAPIAAYLAKGLLFGTFEPLPRFAIAPGAVLLPLAAGALLDLGAAGATAGGAASPAANDDRHRAPIRLGRVAALVAAGGVATSALALALAFARPGRIWTGAESIGPLTRLDREDRALADYLLAHRRGEEGVFIDTMTFTDITITHAARIPASRAASLSQTREPLRTLAESRRLTLASWFAVHDQSWGRHDIPDWPDTGRRFGHWKLAHVGDRQ